MWYDMDTGALMVCLVEREITVAIPRAVLVQVSPVVDDHRVLGRLAAEYISRVEVQAQRTVAPGSVLSMAGE